MRKWRRTTIGLTPAIFVVILFLIVGFAAVTTSLVVNGTIGFAPNRENFDVIFTEAIIDGVKDNTLISSDGKSITFTTKELKRIGDESILDFTVWNNSTQYDAEVKIECEGGDGQNVYYEIHREVAKSIPAQTRDDGKVTIVMTRSSVNEISETLTCTVTASAVERDNIVELEERIYSYDNSVTGLNCDNVQCALVELNELVESRN